METMVDIFLRQVIHIPGTATGLKNGVIHRVIHIIHSFDRWKLWIKYYYLVYIILNITLEMIMLHKKNLVR